MWLEGGGKDEEGGRRKEQGRRRKYNGGRGRAGNSSLLERWHARIYIYMCSRSIDTYMRTDDVTYPHTLTYPRTLISSHSRILPHLSAKGLRWRKCYSLNRFSYGMGCSQYDMEGGAL